VNISVVLCLRAVAQVIQVVGSTLNHDDALDLYRNVIEDCKIRIAQRENALRESAMEK
jgi:hypothetical protein